MALRFISFPPPWTKFVSMQPFYHKQGGFVIISTEWVENSEFVYYFVTPGLRRGKNVKNA
ncbi:hypothetical protein CLOSTASPAR_02621 [[Clostridium] asparagiforme DSM 15981]|jgi:hypothetical protein|uniref:Uncharacterized protein n=1 Tax=[Clostridium] asparagiforme DSM 15981 TaxID=518636 RepID=C0D039_9FIRM|nr:hypothetical protein CLOSTASPAR_02621 [[Clostridium] asparagiforme DSM 15981]